MKYSDYLVKAVTHLNNETTTEQLLMELLSNVGAIAQVRAIQIEHEVTAPHSLSLYLGALVWCASMIKARHGQISLFEFGNASEGEIKSFTLQISQKIANMAVDVFTLKISEADQPTFRDQITEACDSLLRDCELIAGFSDLNISEILEANIKRLEAEKNWNSSSAQQICLLA